jgi:hypothetical protein
VIRHILSPQPHNNDDLAFYKERLSMHIRKSYLVTFSIAFLVVASVALLFTGWVRSSFTPDWNLQHHWDTWTGHTPALDSQNGTGAVTGGTPIGEKPGISPVKPEAESTPTATYEDIAIKSEDLRNRLAGLLARPVRSHEEALRYNLQACPKEVADVQVSWVVCLCMCGD